MPEREASTGRPGEWAGRVIPTGELLGLLERFGMQFGLDEGPEAERELQAAQLGHALVGAAEAHATRTEEAYRAVGAGSADLTQASLMSFAAVNCQDQADELGLLQWRATRLAGALSALDFSGPVPREGEVGSGDTLIRTMRLTAAALAGMAQAAQATSNPHRGPGEAASAGEALSKAMGALEAAAADVHQHRAIGELMRYTDD